MRAGEDFSGGDGLRIAGFDVLGGLRVVLFYCAMATLFSIENEYELLALHRLLFHARFSADTPTETAGMLLTAAMSQRVATALQQHAIAASADAWAGWLQAEGHPREMEFVRLRVADCQDWAAWTFGSGF